MARAGKTTLLDEAVARAGDSWSSTRAAPILTASSASQGLRSCASRCLDGSSACPRHGRRLSLINMLERLTPLELEVSLAAGPGASLDDVAHALFLGARTARLLHASAMAKLSVESTAELAAALGSERSPDTEVSRQAMA